MNISTGSYALWPTLQTALSSVSRLYVRARALPPTCTRATSTRTFFYAASRTPLQAPRPFDKPRKRTQWQKKAMQHGRSIRIFGPRVITLYVEVPPTYRDEEGLPFRRDDLPPSIINQVLGPSIDAERGNRLLRILHGRRVAGTLEDPTYRVNTRDFTEKQIQRGLEYLRQNVQVDEIMCAGLRAEDELQAYEDVQAAKEEEGEEEGDGAKVKAIAKPEINDTEIPEYAGLYKRLHKGGTVPRNVYGDSAFERIWRENQAKRAKCEAEEKKLAEERQKKEEAESASRPGGLQNYQEQPLGKPLLFGLRAPAPSPKMEKYLAAATSKLQAPPTTDKWELLLPSTIFVALVVAISVAYATYYRPPSRSDRLFPDIPPAAATVMCLIGVNIFVWALWKVPVFWPMLNRYFAFSYGVPRPFAILGACMSHQTLKHLAGNMFWLWLVGVRLHDEVGRGNFMATYVSCGALGFLGALYYNVLMGRLHAWSLGASGTFHGVAAAYFWIHRFNGFKVLGLPPDPSEGIQGLGILAAMLSLELWGLQRGLGSSVDMQSHLCGMAAGLMAGWFLERERERKKKASDMLVNREKKSEDAGEKEGTLVNDSQEEEPDLRKYRGMGLMDGLKEILNERWR